MAKLLCALFLAGLAFQANAFSISTEPPNPHVTESAELLPSIFNPLDWISNITSLLNPVNLVSKIASLLNPLSWIPDISNLLNPVDLVKKVADFLNPLSWIPNLKPINWLPNPFKYLPNPLDWFGNDKCTIQPEKGPCDAREQRYYYDQNTNACMKFEYGGCKGNRNNFEKKEDCETACRGH